MRPESRSEGKGPWFLPGVATACLLALGMPGHVGWWPLLLVALVPLLLAARSVTPGRSARMGFVCGLLYHLSLLYWILIVLGRYGGLPWWLSLPALLLLAAYMACFSALFCWLLSLVAGSVRRRGRSVALLVWAAPVLWVGLEYLRGFFLSGFPWMDLGYGLSGQPRLVQAADLGGHHLLSFCLVLGNSLAVGLLLRRGRTGRGVFRGERSLLTLAVLLLVGTFGYSLARYQVMAGELPGAPQARVAVVQGNIDQAVKWSPATKEATVARYLALTGPMLREPKPDLVVWPETALPFYPQRDALINKIVDFTTANNTWLLTGAPLVNSIARAEGGEQFQFFNGALLIGPDGKVGGTHAKQHLVPFGEYVPLRRLLPFLEPLVVSVGDFTAGTSMAPLELASLRLGLLICYESIFPDIARESVSRGANLLVNLTNDAWYGRSSAPVQSLAMAVLRAVETKRTLVRAANTGISGFIDPLGRVSARTAIFTEAALVAPVAMLDQSTVFCRYGYRFGLVCLLLIPLLLVFRFRNGR